MPSAAIARYGARPYGPQTRSWSSQPRSSLLTSKRLPYRLPEATKETINWVSLHNGGQETKAYWLAPNNNPQDAKAIVLFFHGFSQPPTAYVMLLKAVADAGCLVLAPSFPFRSKPKDQQDIYIEEGKEWLQMTVDRSLPSPLNTVTAAAAACRGLLAHSVGGGLAPYFASTAAADGKPFKAVHVLAPMTQVVDPYRSKLANPGPPPEPATGPIPNWPATGSTITKWGIQYGALDTLAPPALALELLLLLLDAEQAGRKLAVPKASEDIISWPLGTHTGFQDQVVNPGKGNSLVDDVLAPLRRFVGVLLSLAPLIQWLLRRLKPKPESELDGEPAAISEPTTRLAASPRLAVRGLQGGKAKLLPRSGLLQAFDGDNDLQLLQLQQEFTQRLAPPPAAPQPFQPMGLRAGAAAPAAVAKQGTEEVDVPMLEESEQEYKFLLAVVVALGLVVTAWSTTWPLPDKLSGVASTLVVALFVYLGVNGVNSLSLLDDCYKEQRPFSRAAAVKFFQDHLL